ncbi:MAG: polyisoprenoid-binding protein, partial [Comamonadaceae bacterium]|nr:polyisoprenoid-binding protein [Comamonadaceae bacterium]
MRFAAAAFYPLLLAAASLFPLAAQAQQQLVPAQSEIQFV